MFPLYFLRCSPLITNQLLKRLKIIYSYCTYPKFPRAAAVCRSIQVFGEHCEQRRFKLSEQCLVPLAKYKIVRQKAGRKIFKQFYYTFISLFNKSKCKGFGLQYPKLSSSIIILNKIFCYILKLNEMMLFTKKAPSETCSSILLKILFVYKECLLIFLKEVSHVHSCITDQTYEI